MREIPLWLLHSFKLPLPLYIGIKIVFPHLSGTLLSFQHLFNSFVTSSLTLSPPFLINSITTPSSPAALPSFIIPNAQSTSCLVISSTISSSAPSISTIISFSLCSSFSHLCNSSKYSDHLLLISRGVISISPFLSLMLFPLCLGFLYVLANLNTFFLPCPISPINSSATSFDVLSFSLLFMSSALFLALTYSSLVCSVLLLSQLLIFTFFSLIASLTSSFHHRVCLFLVPPIHFSPNSFAAVLLIISCNSITSPSLLNSSFSFSSYLSLFS